MFDRAVPVVFGAGYAFALLRWRRVQLVIEGHDDSPGVIEEIGVFERGQLHAENLGLTLAEARELLRGLQQAVITQQTAEFAEQQTHCPTCGAHRARKAAITSLTDFLFR